jgi:hypothetical protein
VIARSLKMKYRTVREIWRRYRQEGEASLALHSDRCGRAGIRFPDTLYQAAVTLKRAHPRWGAALIRVELAEQFPEQGLPGERTLQSWFRDAGLQPLRAKRPQVARDRVGRSPPGARIPTGF